MKNELSSFFFFHSSNPTGPERETGKDRGLFKDTTDNFFLNQADVNMHNKAFCITLMILIYVFGGQPALAADTKTVSSLDIQSCVRRVIQRNPELAMAQATLAQAAQLHASARKNRLPFLSAHYSYTYQPNSIYYPTDEFRYGITAEQPIYQGNAIVSAIEQADISRQSARHETEKVMNELIFRTYTAYFALLRAQKIEEEAMDSVQRLQGHNNDSRSFFKAGLIPRNDYLQTDVELAQGEQDLVDAQAEKAIAQAELNTLLGQEPDTPLTLKDECATPEIEKPDTKQILQQALTARPEMIQARLAVDRAEKEIAIKNAPYLPQVSVKATYDKRGDQPEGRSSDELGWPAEEKTVQAVATWKLWSWQQNRNEVAAARSGLRRARKGMEKIRDQIIIETRTAVRRLIQAEKRIKVSSRAIAHAEENFRISQARYQSQISTSTQVLDAQTMLTRARTNYYDAYYGHKVALAAVQRAAGRLWKIYTPTPKPSANPKNHQQSQPLP